jgi:predicted SnoaL-like aldol condensation-catalyzing enzyme
MVHVRASRPGSPDAAVADIYRFENGRIVEHWDVLQPVPADPVHDHPMF